MTVIASTLSPIKHTWGTHHKQFIECYKYAPSVKDTVITVHGGSWVNTKRLPSAFVPLVEKVDFEANFFSVDYRPSASVLSFAEYGQPDPSETYVKAPFHLIDVLKGIQYIIEHYKVTRLHLIGHSVGAALVLQILDFVPIVTHGLSELVKHNVITKEVESENLEFIHNLAKTWKNIDVINTIHMAGIYDLPLAMKDQKELEKSGALDHTEGFVYILDSHVSEEHYTETLQPSSSVVSKPFQNVKPRGKHVILHPVNDEHILITQPQSLINWFHKWKLPLEFHLDEYGSHIGPLTSDNAFEVVTKTLRETANL